MNIALEHPNRYFHGCVSGARARDIETVRGIEHGDNFLFFLLLAFDLVNSIHLKEHNQ
jgi:hypothetical protein